MVNPVNGERIPMFVADYVLMEYGTGAIMAVPAHDQRDYDFATAFDLPIRPVVAPADGSETEGPFVSHSDDEVAGQLRIRFTGMTAVEAKDAIIDWLDQQGRGHRSINYRLRDWLLSRQRYWGAPIPIVYCDKCGIVPVPEEDLPVLLPDVEDYKPQGPLAAGRRRGLGQHDVPELRRRRRGARPTRWTRSSTRRGTSCATRDADNDAGGLGPRRHRTTGRRSTSTSAASSTRSCTCCTRASS